MIDYDRNQAVITALLTTKTNREASKTAGISEATLYRLLKNPRFVEMLEAARKQVYYATIFKLANLSKDSIECLSNMINTQGYSNTVKLGASKFILDKIIDIYICENLESRISKLENKK